MGIYYPYCFGVFSAVLDGGNGQEHSAPMVIPFIPRHATVHLNSYYAPDSFELELDARVFPISPEMWHSVAVEIYMFQTSELLDQNLQVHKSNGFDAWDLGRYQTEENRVLAGIVNDAKYSLSENGRTINVTGQDYTALMMAKEWPPDQGVDADKNLSEVVQDLVNEVLEPRLTGPLINPVFARDTLTVRLVEAEDVTVLAQNQQLTRKNVKTRTVKKTEPTTKKKKYPVRSGRNYWDVIYNLCLRHRRIAYVKGKELIIGMPHVLTAQSDAQAAKMAYGTNLASLEISRRFGRQAVPQIVASVYDAKNKQTIDAKWPKDDALAPQFREPGRKSGHPPVEITGRNTVREQTLRVTPPASIVNADELTEYCRGIYDLMSKNESTISFKTKALKSINGVDLLQMRAGDPVKLSFEEATTDRDLRNMSIQQRVQRLRELGYSSDLSSLVANTYEKLKYAEKPFYVREASFYWDINSGMEVHVEGMNYAEPQRDGTDASRR